MQRVSAQHAQERRLGGQQPHASRSPRELRTGLPMGDDVKRCKARWAQDWGEVRAIKMGMRYDGREPLQRIVVRCSGSPFSLHKPHGKKLDLKA